MLKPPSRNDLITFLDLPAGSPRASLRPPPHPSSKRRTLCPCSAPFQALIPPPYARSRSCFQRPSVRFDPEFRRESPARRKPRRNAPRSASDFPLVGRSKPNVGVDPRQSERVELGVRSPNLTLHAFRQPRSVASTLMHRSATTSRAQPQRNDDLYPGSKSLFDTIRFCMLALHLTVRVPLHCPGQTPPGDQLPRRRLTHIDRKYRILNAFWRAPTTQSRP